MTDEQREQLVSDTEDYAYLISEKNYERDKYMLLVRSFLEPGTNLIEMIESFNMGFDIDNASGAQLDIIGSLIGAKRLLNFVPSGDNQSREMDDDEFRLVLKLTIAKNTWDGSLGSLDRIYRENLGDSATIRYVDNQNMSVTVTVYGDISTREIEILESSGLLLVPAGVDKTVSMSGGSVTATLYAGIDVTGIEYENSVIARGVDN